MSPYRFLGKFSKLTRLIYISRNSPTALMIQAYEKNIIDDIDRHLIVAADPLLSHLICDVDFREVIFNDSFTLVKVNHLLIFTSFPLW